MLLRAVQGLQKKKKTAAAVEEENNASSPSPLSLSLSLSHSSSSPPPFFTKQSWHWSERRKIEEYYKSLNESK
jgi:hypothetical protein